MPLDFTSEIEKEINKIVYSYSMDYNTSSLYDFDDLKQEARIVAYRVFEKYDNKKKTKLNTFLSICIKNRFKDLRTIQNGKGKLRQELKCNIIDTDCELWSNMDDIEEEINIQQLLTGNEYDCYMKMKAGWNRAEIAKEKKYSRQRIDKCFTRIAQKLKSQEMSLLA